MARGKSKGRTKGATQDSALPNQDDDRQQGNAQHDTGDAHAGDSGDNGNAKSDDATDGQSKPFDLYAILKRTFPVLDRLETTAQQALGDFRVQVTLRILYVLLSTIGSICMIREHPTPIFRGWTAVLLIFGFVTNALIGLAISNRELKLCWLFLRSFSTWHFFYALYQVYPQHIVRVLAIGAVTAAYVYYINGELDRKAYAALTGSLFLVASDTPRLRKIIWTGENARVVQFFVGLFGLSLLGGWHVYRWITLVGLYFANDALLMASFIPANQEDRLQLWAIAASTPALLVYNFASEHGLPSYFALIYAGTMLLIVRPNSPTPDLLAVRTTFTCAIAFLLQTFVFGLATGVSAVLVLATLTYLLVT